MINLIKRISILTLVLLVSACATQQTGSRSSVVSYLYPDGAVPSVNEQIPRLNLPLRMGIAFVPGSSNHRNSSALPWTEVAAASLTEHDKTRMLNQVKAHFAAQPFIGQIEVIPGNYLTPGGSFTNLDQLRAMFNIDVIALVSYDQVQFTEDTKLSLSYWTLVGAYLVSGQKNDTHTLMDTAVYAIESRKLLFRAPGSSQLKGSSTPVDLQLQLRKDSQQGFDQANTDMIAQLETELTAFKERIKQRPNDVQLVNNANYSGGAFYLLLPLLGAIVVRRLVLRRKPAG